jgi:hypothetical protein
MTKKIIGRKDKADLPDINLTNIPVKIDSGAYSCSIHCESVAEIFSENKQKLEVVFLDVQHPNFTGEKFIFDTFRRKKVKNSTGYEQERYFIQLKILFFGEEIKTDFSLTKRNGLKNPILIGRKLLNDRFVIDTSAVNLSFKEKRKK